MEAKDKVAGQPTPDADSNDHLREAVKTETPIFGQAVTKGAMLNFPNQKKDGLNFYQKYCAHTEKLI